MNVVVVVEAKAAALVPVPAAPEHEVRLLEVAATAFRAMTDAARRDGVGLVAVSGFRSVERQTAIWNRKFLAGREEGLGERAAIDRILEYSAPPGWSRHHWGTDVDLVEDTMRDEPRLEPEDWEEGAPCGRAAAWLEEHAILYGFARPYVDDLGGFLPEPWHWSYVPAAGSLQQRVDAVSWKIWFRAEPFLGAGLLAADAESLYARYRSPVA